MKWRRLISKKVFENNFISIFDEEVIAPTGCHTKYGRVHFHRKAASILVVNFENQEILLVGQERYPLNFYSWETIQGGGDLEDEYKNIARRELREEGEIDSMNLNLICNTNTSNSVTDEKANLYWCDFKDTFNSNNYERDETELISRKWFKLDEALEMIRKSEITDALTQISIFFIWNYLNEVKSKQV